MTHTAWTRYISKDVTSWYEFWVVVPPSSSKPYFRNLHCQVLVGGLLNVKHLFFIVARIRNLVTPSLWLLGYDYFSRQWRMWNTQKKFVSYTDLKASPIVRVCVSVSVSGTCPTVSPMSDCLTAIGRSKSVLVSFFNSLRLSEHQGTVQTFTPDLVWILSDPT